jgi:SIR2-like domain
MSAAGLQQHARLIGRLVDEGKVIPFLGAGANLCDRPPKTIWQEGGRYLPSGSELSRHLAARNEYPGVDDRDLVRVAQYVDLITGGEAELFSQLRAVFTGTYEPNRLHHYLAALPGRQRAAGRSRYQLIVTTNYDDCLERAFATADEPVDVVYYAAEHGNPGRFVHLAPSGDRRAIPKHTDYRGLDLEQRPVILKIHGDFDAGDAAADNYVITEDHYIDYLAHGNLSKLIPAYLMARMRNSHFVFLGYGMRDWNLRVILHHIWSQQVRKMGSWAVERDPDPIDEEFWRRHNVRTVEARLEDWVDAMNEASA